MLRNARRIALGSLVAWHAVESGRVAPDYLAYFNQLAGGPAHGYRHLVDSSLDWGQDLPALKAWLDENWLQGPGHTPVFLSYFGTSHPEHYAIDAIALPGFPDRGEDAMPPALSPGVYCISATMLQGLYVDAKPPWTADNERVYRAAIHDLALWQSTATNPTARAALISHTGAEFWRQTFRAWDQLRFARITALLRTREPDAQIGYSILVYRVTEQDLERALTPQGDEQPRKHP